MIQECAGCKPTDEGNRDRPKGHELDAPRLMNHEHGAEYLAKQKYEGPHFDHAIAADELIGFQNAGKCYYLTGPKRRMNNTHACNRCDQSHSDAASNQLSCHQQHDRRLTKTVCMLRRAFSNLS